LTIIANSFIMETDPTGEPRERLHNRLVTSMASGDCPLLEAAAPARPAAHKRDLFFRYNRQGIYPNHKRKGGTKWQIHSSPT
jgi:hypothetical protein